MRMHGKAAIAPTIVAAGLLCACAAAGKHVQKAGAFGDNYYEPSIERGLEIAAKSGDGAALIAYLQQNSLGIKYTSLNGPWAMYDPQAKIAQLPEKVRGDDYTVGLMLVRALAEFHAIDSIGLDQNLLEIEETAALAQSRALISLGVPDEKALAATAAGKQALDEACAYMIEGQPQFIEMVDRDALAPLPEYARPLDTLPVAKRWLMQYQDALQDGTLPQVVYRHDMEKVRKGIMSKDDAIKNQVTLHDADPGMLLRMNRDLYYRAERRLEDASNFQKSQKAQDLKWREEHAALINMRISEIHHCQFYVPKFSVSENPFK
jgi:hypothetical protein